MRSSKLIVLFLLFIGLTSCNDNKKLEVVPTETTSTYYFIRHAEKDRSDEQNPDPELSQTGLGRAMHWAEILRDVPLDAIYSTDFRRTSMTAAPTSVKKNIDVQYYDPQTLDIETFKSENLDKNVLVVGHSNTTPDMVNRMLGTDTFDTMDDNDNGSLFIVQIVNSKATVQRLHFSCNCPKRK